MDTVSIEDVSSNLNAVASTAATDDNNSLNSKLKLNGGSLIEILSNMPYVLSIIGQSGPICDKINKDFWFWDNGKDYDHAPISNEESETVFAHDYSDNGDTVLSDITIDSNPSKIPNNGDRIVLLSSVSRVIKNESRNDEVVQDNKDSIDELDASQREHLHDYSNNYDAEYVDIPSSNWEWI